MHRQQLLRQERQKTLRQRLRPSALRTALRGFIPLTHAAAEGLATRRSAHTAKTSRGADQWPPPAERPLFGIAAPGHEVSSVWGRLNQFVLYFLCYLRSASFASVAAVLFVLLSAFCSEL